MALRKWEVWGLSQALSTSRDAQNHRQPQGRHTTELGRGRGPQPKEASSSSSSSSSSEGASSSSNRMGMPSTSQNHHLKSGTASDHLTSAISKFREAYNQQLTRVMYMAGTAMAPALNKAGLEDRDALEKLVVRTIPRPSSRTVLVGDVVAFNSPLTLGTSSDTNEFIMVRRVAAMEGDEMVAASSSDSEEQQVEEHLGEVPKGHCWVLADNEDLKPPEVIDSRTFGYIPLTNIVGRVIYAASTRKDHGPVINNPASVEADQAIIEGEVDVDRLCT
mmetsp:Transcript_28687/g.73956  ORF Transcript_28687/g.73956 Transcript_28687/m.73956 type:complete len:276 (-) Transcript_28687:616-1443(-)